MKNIRNAKPKSYKAFYITPGLADYTAEGIGTVLVGKEALDKIAPTYVGKPVVNLEHTDKEPEELFELSKNSKPEDFADGIIAATGFDEKTGWHWMDFLVWDQDTQENIDEHGYSVSCAYDVTETDEDGGTYNNVPYDEEVLNGEALHLAIVPNPRYERAYVIQNSKSEEEVLKIVFKKKDKKAPVKKKKVQNAEPETEDDEEETMENSDGYIENSKGEQFPIAELVNMYKAKKNAAKKVYNMDDEVTVDGKKMKVSELMAAVEEDDEDELENAEPAQDEDAEEVVDETLQNATSGKPVKNANFKKVKNAADKEDKEFKPKNLNTVSERLGRGKSRYGTPVAQGGK